MRWNEVRHEQVILFVAGGKCKVHDSCVGDARGRSPGRRRSGSVHSGVPPDGIILWYGKRVTIFFIYSPTLKCLGFSGLFQTLFSRNQEGRFDATDQAKVAARGSTPSPFPAGASGGTRTATAGPQPSLPKLGRMPTWLTHMPRRTRRETLSTPDGMRQTRSKPPGEPVQSALCLAALCPASV